MAESSPSTTVHILEVVALVVAVVVPSIFYFRGKRDNRIASVIEMIREMESKGVEYWSYPESDPTSKSRATDIKRLSKHIGFEISRGLKLPQSKRLFIQKKLTVFRVTITGGAFEQRDRPEDHARTKQINTLCIALIEALRN